ncbi:MAG: DUF3426 domain-containing protein [Gammaproteobacteria bacterium]
MQAICPHCQTVFKVSDENLRAADGFVRCGICKEVFNALEKDLLINKKAPVVQTKIASSAETPVKKTIESNDTDPVEFILEQSHEVSTSKNQSSLSASDKPSNQKENITSSKHETQSNLFKPPLDTKKPEAITASTKATPANTEITQRIKPEALNTRPPVSKTKPTVTASAIPSTASAAKTTNITAGPNKVADNNLFDGVQSKLIPDEYRIPVLHNTHSIWKDLVWSLAILVLTASLFVEYTWFNRNELIRNPQLRPLITQFCSIADCGPMNLREPGEIEMTTRNIYTHPNVKNALMISGTLINHAPFEQPYPNILIDFSNVRGEVTASRIFTPEDYLQIKLSSLKPLTPNVSIDFTMEIQDPGKNAMTYEFSFL